jgi:hypothetical protein
MTDPALATEPATQVPLGLGHATYHNAARLSSANQSGTPVLNDSLATTLVDRLPGVSSSSLQSQIPSNSGAAPAAQVTPKKEESTEPLTISLKADLVRKARILAASKGITVSRLIAGILADTVRRELPAAVADLYDPQEGDDQ